MTKYSLAVDIGGTFTDAVLLADDGRAWSVSLTSEGKRLFRRLKSQTEAQRERLVSTLRADEVDALLDMLSRIAQEMEEARSDVFEGSE